MAGYGPAVRYERNAVNLGLAGNWNHCLAVASTDLVTLLHADDELLPGYVAAVLGGHERHPSAAAVFPSATVIGPLRGQVVAPDLAKRVIARRRSSTTSLPARRVSPI